MLEKTERQNFLYRLQEWFGSDFTAVFFLLFGALCWNFGWSEFLVVVYATSFVLTLLICKNVKNVFVFLFFIAFFIKQIEAEDSVWSVYVPCVAICAISVIAFVVSKLAAEKNKIKSGKMFFPIVVYVVVMMIGGAIGRFNVTAFFIFLGFGTELLFFYLIAINHTEGLSDFLAKIFIVGAILIIFCLLSNNLKEGKRLFAEPALFIVAQNVNTSAIFIALGMAGCFYLGVGKRKDYLYIVLSLVLLLAVIYTRCRTMIIISIGLFIAEHVLFFVFSKYKLAILCLTGLLVFAVIIGFIVFNSAVKSFIVEFMDKDNVWENPIGVRKILWQWCIDRFNEYPYFGYGYINDGYVPSLVSFYPNIVLAHNTVLQWLTATGVVGSAIATYFYLCKYSVLFSRFNKNKIFHTLCILTIALSGTFDQSPTMDIFVLVATVVILAASEKTTDKGFISTAY